MSAVLLVAAGAAFGAPARYLVDRSVTRRFGADFPWGTLVVNVLGSVLLGVVVAVCAGSGRLALGVGFCGAFTTYSTFSAQSWDLWEWSPTGAGLNVLATVAGSIIGLSLALAVMTTLVR